MPKWITSTWYSVDYGWEYESKGGVLVAKTENFVTPEEVLRLKLNKLTDALDARQYTIKAIIPKTHGLACHDSCSSNNSSYGWGYGVTPITGFVVLAQQEREVSQEEYERLSKALALKNKLPALREKYEKLQNEVDTNAKRKMEITEKKPLIGKLKHCVAEKEYGSREEAQNALAAMQADHSAKRVELAQAQAELECVENELKVLEG